MNKALPKATLQPRTPTNRSDNSPTKILQKDNSILLGDLIRWDLSKVPNPHMVILGTSGSGKTQTLKAIISELDRLTKIKLIVIDFHGDQQLKGEKYFPLNMSSEFGINPLKLNLDPHGGGCKLQSIAVASTLRRSLLLGVNQEGLLIMILDDLYSEFGIDQDDRSSWLLNPPHFGDLQQAIETRAASGCSESSKLRIKMAATFQYSVFSKSQIDLDSGKLIRIDLSKLPPELGSIASEALLKQLMDSHRLNGESGEMRTFIFIDEAKELKGSKLLDRITADGRKYGLGVVLASQRETHLSPDILANSATKIVLAVDAADVRKVASRFRFDAGRIANLDTFQALVRMGQQAHTCTIQPHYLRSEK